MKPAFLIAGIMKSGTTFLDNLVRRHPDIAMPERSMDYSFFDHDAVYKKGMEWYESIFDSLDSSALIGQTSADCAFNPGSIERIKKHLPNAKLIFILRNPIDRAYSLYWHQVKMGREYKSFEEVLKLEAKRIKKSYYNFKMYSYLERSKYAKQMKVVFEHFDEENVLVLPFEVVVKDEIRMLNKVFDFLGVKRIKDLSELNLTNIPKNQGKIPKYKLVLYLTSILHRMNLTGLGRFILSFTLTEKRPPKMLAETRSNLEEVLKDDLELHTQLVQKYSKQA